MKQELYTKDGVIWRFVGYYDTETNTFEKAEIRGTGCSGVYQCEVYRMVSQNQPSVCDYMGAKYLLAAESGTSPKIQYNSESGLTPWAAKH